MSLSVFLTIPASLFLFGYALFRWNGERINTKHAINYIKIHTENTATVGGIKDAVVEGEWSERWQRFLTSIVDVPNHSRPRTSVKPEELFTLSYTQKKFGLNLRSMASLPSNLTGVGIAFTFLGLVIGVTNASGALAATNSGVESNLLAMIEPLLQGAGLAFCTSLAGLFGSLVYSIGSQYTAGKLQAEIDQWNLKMDERCPFISPAELQVIMIAQHEQQAGQMERLPQHITSGIGDGITQIMHDIKNNIKERDEASAEMMESKFDSMIMAFNDNIGKMSDSFGSSLEKLTKNFNRSIRQMAGDEMELFANQLKELHQKYVESQQQIIDKKDEFLNKSTDHAAQAFNQTNEMAALLSKSTNQVAIMTGDIVDHVNELRDQIGSWVKEEVEASGKLLSETMESAGTLMTDGASKAGHILVRASEDSKNLLISAAQSMSDTYDGMEDSIVHGAEEFTQSLKRSGDTVSQALAQGLQSEIQQHSSNLRTDLHAHIKAQKGIWEIHEEALTSIYKTHSQEVQSLSKQLGTAFNHIQKEFKQYEEGTNRYVEGLDKDASQVLNTLSKSIDEMERISQQLASLRMREFIAEVA